MIDAAVSILAGHEACGLEPRYTQQCPHCATALPVIGGCPHDDCSLIQIRRTSSPIGSLNEQFDPKAEIQPKQSQTSVALPLFDHHRHAMSDETLDDLCELQLRIRSGRDVEQCVTYEPEAPHIGQ